MNKARSLILTTALTLISMTGLGFTSTSPAQASDNATEPSITHQMGPTQEHTHRSHPRRSPIIRDTAELLGISQQNVLEQLRSGKTLLQVAKSQKGWTEGQYVQQLTAKAFLNIDRAVAAGRLDSLKANQIKTVLPAKIKKVIHLTWNNHLAPPLKEAPNNTVSSK
jgi:hypothetical protein